MSIRTSPIRFMLICVIVDSAAGRSPAKAIQMNLSSVSEQPGLSHTANAASAVAESVARQGFSPQVDNEVPFAAEIRTPIHR
jgi:hypothetical protein